MRRRVAITGLGAITATGETLDGLWDACLKSRSAISFLPEASMNGWKPVGGVIREFKPERFVLQKKALKVMARDIQLAVAGASLALESSALTPQAIARDRIGVVVGSGVLNHELDELAYSIRASLDASGRLDLKKFGQEGIPSLFPLWLLKYLPNMSACHISILFDLQGPNNTITTGSSGGLQAIGEAVRIIERGAADVMLAGGAESKTNPVGLSQYRILKALADADGKNPQNIYRPFDEKAAGVVVGEGAAFLVLEDWEHAKKRGAKVYAEIAGFGASDQSGLDLAMAAALREADISARDVDSIQACGLGLLNEDEKETAAIERVFSSHPDVLVSASKPVTGFTGYAAGALDAVIASLGITHQTICPVMNFERARQTFRFRLVKDVPVRKKIKHALVNTFGFGGQCASLVIREAS